MKCLWEILVPVKDRFGNKISLSYHKYWDSRIKKISKGLTVCRPVRGIWVSPSKVEFEEPMIPVQILCHKKDMSKIVSFTKTYYDQEKVLAYKISSDILYK